jgi:hypothetical protein
MVADASGNQRHPRANAFTIIEAGFEKIARMDQLTDRHRTRFDTIRPQLLTAEPQQFEGGDAVTREKAVQGRRTRIPGTSRIAEQQVAAAASQHQRSVQTGRTATDNEDVVHAGLKCKGIAIPAVRTTLRERFRL